MKTLGIHGAAHKARLVGGFAGSLLLALAQTATAQQNAPSEAAQRAAASPYRFILQSSTAPRKPAAAAPAAAPAPAAAVAEPKKPAPAVQQAAMQPSATQQPNRTAPAPAVAEPAPAPAPAPEAVAALSKKPEAPPARREIIPISTDEPRLSPALLREEPHGTVQIQFDIHPDGSVQDVKVTHSSNRSLNKPTVEAVQSWKFQPVDEVLTVQTEVVYNLDKK
jgi:TonB family protein